MEVFTGERCMPTDVVLYPDNLIHFPSDSDNHSPEIFTQPPPPPPQKLRPIRCNPRNSANFSYPAGGVEGSLISCYGPPAKEFGFFTRPSTEKHSEGKEGGESSGGLEYLRNCPLPGILGSLVGVECNKLLGQAQKFEAQLSPLPDGGEETLKAIEKPSNRKRKRRRRAKLESYVENMIMSVMQKQEESHRQMMEILEKKEEECLAREEAWKQQQIERANREREERAQETSRSLALISFIQKFMGHEIKIPVPLKIMSQEKEGYEIEGQENITCVPSNNQEKVEELLKCVPLNKQEDLKRDPINRSWSNSEVQALINVRTALFLKFDSKGPKNCIWEEVAMGMSNLGYCRTAKKCQEKWENMNKYYRKVMENGSTKRSDKSKVCQYFNEIDMLYKSGLVGSGNLEPVKKVIEEQSVLEEEKGMLAPS